MSKERSSTAANRPKRLDSAWISTGAVMQGLLRGGWRCLRESVLAMGPRHRAEEVSVPVPITDLRRAGLCRTTEARLPPGGDEPALVRDDDGLHAVAHAELAEQA